MTCEEARREINKVLIQMKEYQWKSAQETLKGLYSRLNETPADIHNGYGYYEEHISDNQE